MTPSLRLPYILLAITSLYALTALGTALFFGATWKEIISLALFSGLTIFQLFVFFIAGQFLIAFRNISTWSPAQILKTIDTTLSSSFRGPYFQRGLSFIPALYPLFLGFSAFKSLIPLIHPYDLDGIFAEWDKTLHGGLYPHHYLGELAENLTIIHMAEYIYYAWFLVIIGAMTYALFYDRDENRRRCYIVGSIASWILLGTIGAILLSSVGPIFYGEFYSGANPYADIWGHFQMAEANGAIFWSEGVRILIDITRDETICDLNGISAMPSMHVGTSFLITLYAFSIQRKWGILAALFTILIFISSLILGFHYAIDGYFSCVVVAGMWWLYRKVFKIARAH